jgi:hypothetical protein
VTLVDGPSWVLSPARLNTTEQGLQSIQLVFDWERQIKADCIYLFLAIHLMYFVLECTAMYSVIPIAQRATIDAKSVAQSMMA